MSLQPIPTDPHATTREGRLTPFYQAWFASIQRWLSPVGQFGTTTTRPTTNLFIGQPYFDTTLGYMVWIKQVSPSVIWVNGAGTAV